jgi:beta-mannosidase
MPVYDSLPYKVPISFNDQADKRVSTFTRKAGYHFGWDWGPRFVTSGIWRPLYLQAWNYVRIDDLFIKQLQLTDQTAKLEAQITTNATEQGVKTIQIFVDNNPKPIVSKQILVLKGENSIATRFEMKNIECWWPNGMGVQKLYLFKAVISDGNKPIVSSEVKRGLRTIEVVNENHEKGKSFYFKVNGKAVFMKGANYIPQDNFLTRVTRERYEHVINTAITSNMNMLRVWGGGIYENDLFYELCDEKGILVWQDFMFACAMFPPFESLKKNIQAEAVYNVKRLRNHPSIALWCGNNEVLQFINQNFWGHMKETYKTTQDSASLYNSYFEVFNGILPGAVKAYDDEKFYWSSSASNENYATKFKFTTLTGDVHYWGVWWSKEPFEKYNEVVGPFMSEYGFQSFPELETVKTYALPEDYDINSEVMNAHQRSNIGNGTITYYMKDLFKVPAKFEDFLYVGQVLQAEGIKTAIEAHRRAKPYCMGSLFWQIDDCWPVASWSSMDYYGRWKAQQYMAKRAYTDFMVSALKTNDSIKIYAITDKQEPVNAQIQISLIDFNGKVLKTITQQNLLAINSSSEVFSLNEADWITPETRKNVVLNMKLLVNNETVTENNYYFEKSKNLNLPNSIIQIKQIGTNSIELSTNKLAKSVWLLLPGTINGFSDNYFDLLPGEKRIIEVKADDVKMVMKTIQVKHLKSTY